MTASAQILFPVGRLVAGSLYKPNDKDAEGRPLVAKSGPSAGQPRVDYFFGVAIPKGTEQHWAQTPWGSQIWQVGGTAFPAQAQSPTFAWKIKDGDSAIPNRKGKKPCDNEGWRGHWVVMFSGGFAPKVYQIPAGQRDPVIWPDKDAVNLGDYVEVFGNVAGNNSATQPGVFLNHGMVCFRGYGERIVLGPDATAVGFGQNAAPAGASTVPVGATAMPGAPAVAAPPVMAPPVAMPALPVGVPSVQVPAIPAATIAPHLPVPGTPPVMPAAPPAAPPAMPAGPMPTPKLAASGFTLEQFRAQGWTDDALRSNGYIV